MRHVSIVVAIVMVGAVPDACRGHGSHCTVVVGGTAVEAVYHDGGPMAFCDVEIYRPGDEQEPFHTGETDPRGRFAFVPDTTGTWRVRVDDGMGHVATTEVVIGADMMEAAEPRHVYDRMSGTIVGVSVIFGLFGLAALVHRRIRKTG